MNRAVVLEATGCLAVVEREHFKVGPGEALVEVKWIGICGSDIDLRNGTRPAEAVRYPIVPGHEWSGVVEAIGDGVDSDLLHKPVVGENIRSCGDCDECRAGQIALCRSGYSEAGFTIDGAWADRILVRATQLHVLPGHADLRSAAGIEPAACAATAVRAAHVEERDVVAVVGGGTIGMLCTQLISSRGNHVTVVDPQSWKRASALQCGASKFIDPESALSHVAGFDVVVEAAGVAGSTQFAVDLVRRGGRVIVCGIAPLDDSLHVRDIVAKNISIFGVFGASRQGWTIAVAEFSTGALNPGVLVTHEFRLDEIENALTVVGNAEPFVGKVLLKP